MGEQPTMVEQMVLKHKPILTRTVLSVTCETTKTEAGMAANCVDTLGKLTALLLPCCTLVHI